MGFNFTPDKILQCQTVGDLLKHLADEYDLSQPLPLVYRIGIKSYLHSINLKKKKTHAHAKD